MPPPEPAGAATEASRMAAMNATLGRMKILVVEDEERVAHFIQKGLKEEGHAVDVSYDGEDGEFLAEITTTT